MVCYLGRHGLSRYHLTSKLQTVSIGEAAVATARSHFSDGFVSDTAYKLGDIKDGCSKRGGPRRTSDGPRRLGNGGLPERTPKDAACPHRPLVMLTSRPARRACAACARRARYTRRRSASRI